MYCKFNEKREKLDLDSNLIETFCIVNYHKSTILRFEFRFNRNILYCKFWNLKNNSIIINDLIETFCIVNQLTANILKAVAGI